MNSLTLVLAIAIMGTIGNGVNGLQRGHQLNIYGRPLAICSTNPMTGWYRDGFAHTDSNDHGLHTVCAEMTAQVSLFQFSDETPFEFDYFQFLSYTRSMGNDLSTARGSFPGLRPGDRWALCAARWRQAYEAGYAPRVYLEGTNQKALDIVQLRELESMDSRSATP